MEPMLVGGERRPSASGAILEVFNPANSELIACVPDADAQDAEDALAAADAARSSWARTPLHERVVIVHRFLALVGERREELAELLTLETGKPIRESYEEVDEICAVFRAFAERVGNAMYGIATQLDLQHGLAEDYLLTRREPLGVVVAILPFNFPIEMYAHKVGAGTSCWQRRGGQAERGDAADGATRHRVASRMRCTRWRAPVPDRTRRGGRGGAREKSARRCDHDDRKHRGGHARVRDRRQASRARVPRAWRQRSADRPSRRRSRPGRQHDRIRADAERGTVLLGEQADDRSQGGARRVLHRATSHQALRRLVTRRSVLRRDEARHGHK